MRAKMMRTWVRPNHSRQEERRAEETNHESTDRTEREKDVLSGGELQVL